MRGADYARGVLRGFFAERFPGRQLAEEDDIFALGFANSLFAMQLVDFVESAFAVQIEDDDLDIANFRSIAGIARLVERKLERAVA